MATPRATFDGAFLHPNLFGMAAAYTFHIAQKQPFVDANKRTGLVTALVFLDLNGVVLEDPQGLLHQAMLDLAEKRLDKDGLAGLLRSLSVVIEPSGEDR